MTSQPSAQDVMNLRKATGMAVLEAKRFLIEKDTELVKRILLAYELVPKDSSGFKMYLLVDHQEQDEVIGPIIRRVLDEEGK